PRAKTTPLMTPPQRTRGPTGGTPSGAVSYTPTARAGCSCRVTGGITSRRWSITSRSVSVLLFSIEPFSSSPYLLCEGIILWHDSLPSHQHAPPWRHPACRRGYTDMGGVAPCH